MKPVSGAGLLLVLLGSLTGCGPETQPASVPASSPSSASLDASLPVASRPAMTHDMLKMRRRPWNTDIWGPPPQQDGNAADGYVKAFTEYNLNARAIQDGIDAAKEPAKLDATVVGLLEKVQSHIAAASQKKEMRFTFDHTARSFDVSPKYAPIEEMDNLTYPLYVLAEYHAAKGQFDKAREALKQIYTFGWHTAQDGSRVTMVVGGEKFSLYAEGLLCEIYDRWDVQHADKARTIRENLKREVREGGDDKFQRVWGPGASPADIFAIIAHDEDKAWRIDAILALGMLRFSHSGDMQVTMKVADLIDRYFVSGDPFEAAAAKAAKELTREQFNRVSASLAEKK